MSTSRTQRLSAIVLLLAMGLISNQLPMIWLSYNTVNASYALNNCVNKTTSCAGACTMKREFVRSNQSESLTGLPQSIVETAVALSPFLILRQSVELNPLLLAKSHPLTCGSEFAVSFTADSEKPPPEI